MGIEEGRYWSSDSSHTFGVAKSTDDQLQCFLRETLLIIILSAAVFVWYRIQGDASQCGFIRDRQINS